MRMSRVTSYVLVSTAVLIFLTAEEIRWDLMHQNDYDVIPHRVEVQWYNKTCVHIHQCDLVKYNRTYRRTLNLSLTLYKELRKDFTASIQLYKFLSNTYKFFPVTLTVKVCEEYERNTINLQYIFKRYTNIESCPPKPGYLNTTYLDVDYTKFPPLIPHGDYRADIEVVSGANKFIVFEYFLSIVSPPKRT